jgi:hypothetical protein
MAHFVAIQPNLWYITIFFNVKMALEKKKFKVSPKYHNSQNLSKKKGTKKAVSRMRLTANQEVTAKRLTKMFSKIY